MTEIDAVVTCLPDGADLEKISECLRQGRPLDGLLLAGDLKKNQVRWLYASPDHAHIAIRLLNWLGASSRAGALNRVACRLYPESPDLFLRYLPHLANTRGPLAAWREIGAAENSGPFGIESKHRYQLLCVKAEFCARWQDFDEAFRWIDEAEKIRSGHFRSVLARAFVLQRADRRNEAIEALRETIHHHPGNVTAPNSLADLLINMDREDEATEVLRDASGRLQDFDIVLAMANRETERGRYREALALAEDFERLQPLADQPLRRWVAGWRAFRHYLCGDRERALVFAEQSPNCFIAEIKDRLTSGEIGQRVELAVPFVRQDRRTCAPATLAAIERFWGRESDHGEIAEEICYDGTPPHRERQWAADRGYYVREFRVERSIVRELIDRGIPFTLTTVEPASAHLQAVIGYDSAADTILVREPGWSTQAEYRTAILDDYAFSGPRGMIFLPPEQVSLLEGLTLPEVDVYDLLHQVQEALEKNDRAPAACALGEMRQKFPGHRLTVMGDRAMARWDNHPGAQLEATEALLALYPEQPALSFSKLVLLRNTAGRAEQIDFARKFIATGKAPPEAHSLLAERLDDDARDWPAAELAWDRVTRMKPYDGSTLEGFADFRWEQHRRDEALFYYRLASCCDILYEPYARSYFSAARWAGNSATESALTFLRQRCAVHGHKSGDPALTLAFSLESLQRHGEALKVLEEAIHRRPGDGSLMLRAAESFRNAGRNERAASLLEAAKPLVRAADWLRQAAEDAVSRANLPEAIECYRSILETEPMARDVHSSLARLLAGTEGVEAAIRHLEETCRCHPGNAALHSLLCEWLDEDLERRIAVLGRLLKIDPADDWAMREMAMDLQKLNRFDEALAHARQALEMAPAVAPSHGILADTLLAAGGSPEEAGELLRRALELDADYTWAISKSVAQSHTPEAQREALRWIISRMKQQVIDGNGLRCWQQEAWPILEPDEILSILREVHAIRPDLLQVWSVLGRHLMAMGRVDEAIAVAREAAERFPLLLDAWFELAVQLSRIGDAEGEREALQQALALNPQSGPSVRRMATVCETLGDLPAAKNWLETHARRRPLDIAVRLDLGRLLRMEKGEEAAREALETARRAVSIAPLDSDSWELFAGCVRDSGDASEMEQALAQAEEMTRTQSHCGDAWRCRALAASILRGRSSELAIYDEALQNLPDSWDVRDRRSVLLAEFGRYEEALESCAVGEAPPSQSHWRRARHADILYRQGLPDQAIAEMEALAADRPDYIWAARRLVEWHDHRAEQEAVLRWSAQVSRLDPHDEVGWGYQADALLHLGRIEEAEDCLRKAVVLSPGYRWGAIELLKLELDRGDLAAASLTVARVIGRVPASALASTFRQMGFPEKAVELCRSAVERDSTEWSNHSALSDALWKLGEEEESIDALLQAAFLAPRHHDIRHRLVERAESTGSVDTVGSKLSEHLAEAPADADRHSLTSDFWCRLGNTPAYLSALDAAIAALSPEDRNEFADLKAEHLALNRRYREALQVCAAHDTETAPNAMIRRRRAWIEAARGDLPKAIATMEDALRLIPESSWGLRQICDWLEEEKRGEEAIPHAEKLVAIEPDSGISFGYLASALIRTGKKDQAEPHLVRAFRMKPDYEWAALNLFDLQMDREDFTAATVTVRMMLEHQPGPSTTLKQLLLACATEEEETAFSAWQQLLEDESTESTTLREADRALESVSEWKEALDKSWESALALPEPRLPVVAHWTRRLCDHGDPRIADQLGNRNPPLPEEALVEAWHTFLSISSDQSRGRYGLNPARWRKETRRAIRKNRDLFRSNNRLWGLITWYLLTIEDFSRGRKWCADWRKRSAELETWMTVNVACLLEGKWFKNGGIEVRQWALENLPMDHGASFHRATLAMIAAARRESEKAAVHLENIRDQDFEMSDDPHSMRFQVRLARLLVDLQDSSVPLASRRQAAAKAFREALLIPGRDPGSQIRTVFLPILRLGGFSRLSWLTLGQIPKLWKA